MHELVTRPPDRPGENLELVQGAKVLETPATVRCPSCNGLRTITYRNRQTGALCPECRKGRVVSRTQFHNYWLARFSMDEINDMGRAIWG